MISNSEYDEEYLFSTTNDKSKVPTVTMRVNTVQVKITVDTVAS